MESQRVMVTGGDGFLGRLLMTALEVRGHDCYSYDFTKGQDILNMKQLSEFMEHTRPDVVYHLAAISDLYIHRADPERSDRINIEGTKNVVDACKMFNARCLFASTCCAYGNNDCHPSNEESPLCPTEVYAKSKKTAEVFINEAGLPHTNLRLATFYGPTMRTSLVHYVFLDRVHRGLPLKIHGDGKQTRTYTFVDDVVSGMIAVMESDQHFQAVNISHNESCSVLDVAKYAMEAVGRQVPIEHVDDRPGQIFTEEIDNSRLRSMGWKHTYSLGDGMKKAYEGMLKGPLKDVPLGTPLH